jgi:hypothetical protein
MKTSTAIFIIWADVLAAYPLAVVLYKAMGRFSPHSQLLAVRGSSSIVLGVLACAVVGISFTMQGVNVIAVALAYFSFCYLAVSVGKIGNKLSRFLATALATITIGIGYVLGTVGFLVLMLMVSEFTDPPAETLNIADNLRCDITTWGTVLSDSGHTVHLYRRWEMLPFFEKEVSTDTVNYTNRDDGEKGVTCQSLAAMYMGKKRR